MYRDPGPHKIGKVCELGAHQILNINSMPLILDQQVLIGRKCLDALSEALDKTFRLTSRGLVVALPSRAMEARVKPAHGDAIRSKSASSVLRASFAP